jgi:hypothetical protein
MGYDQSGWRGALREYDAIREAKDQAARVAERYLGRMNEDWQLNLAIEVLNNWIAGIDTYMAGGYRASWLHDPATRLAWALNTCEKSADALASHEANLLKRAWAKVVELGLQQQWETMG